MIEPKPTLPNDHFPVTPAEWRWVILWSSLILLITTLPYLYGWTLNTTTQQFSGFFLGVEDANSYLAKMRMGAEGGWLFKLAYTSEPHAGAYLFTFHLLLGKIARTLNLSPVLIYHAARLIFGLGLLLTIYCFIASFTPNISQRRFTFLLVAGGSGLGWLVVLSGLDARLGLPLDFYVPEGFIFLVLLHLPHLALAESLLFWSFMLVLTGWQQHRWWSIIIAGLSLFLMSLITAFYIAVFAIVLGLTWLIIALQERAFFPSFEQTPHPNPLFRERGCFGSLLPLGAGLGVRVRVRAIFTVLLTPSATRRLGQLMLPGLMAAPVLLYDAYIFTTNPIFKIWSQQNIILSPTPWHYAAAYGLLIIPALFSWPILQTQVSVTKRWFLLVWCFIFPILVYLPFNLQRRLVVGVQLPLAILAAYGSFRLFQKWVPSHKGEGTRWLLYPKIGAILVVSLTNLLLLGSSFITISGQFSPVFLATSELKAITWLDSQTQGEVVLAAHDTGNLLPAYANVRVFVGHGPETIHSLEKQALTQQFFSEAVDDAWRINLLREFKVQYLYFGANERKLGDFNPQDAPYLEKIYDENEVQIFKVQF